MNKWLTPRLLLHVEGAAVLALALVAYGRTDGRWLLFGLSILAPDLAALGYLVNVRVGSVVYNLAHTYTWPILFLTVASLGQWPVGVSLALIWFAHIGGDRLLGFGLKYPTTFNDTHLNRV